ncbi:MAG TPA: hypothetical protein VJP06_02130 [Thermoplasmata archaeon]|nr:hypothetical protein [Thermoplasmata archaeon]
MFVGFAIVTVANYSEVVFAKIVTDAVFNTSVAYADPSADPAISDNATFVTWVNVTLVNPSDRRLTMHFVSYTAWIHDLEVENGSALDRFPQDNVMVLPDSTVHYYFRAFAGSVTFPTPTEFLEPHSQLSLSFSFTLTKALPFRFDSTRSIVRFAVAHNLTWANVDWFHHVVVQMQVLGVPTNYEETAVYYLHLFPIIQREAGYELR